MQFNVVFGNTRELGMDLPSTRLLDNVDFGVLIAERVVHALKRRSHKAIEVIPEVKFLASAL